LLSPRSYPQTMSSYIHDCNSLCTRTDLSWLCKIAKLLFIFTLLYFSFGLTTQEGVWEKVISQVSHGHSYINRKSHGHVTWWVWESSAQTM